MKQLLFISIVLLASCSGNYSIEDSMTQSVNVESINYLIIECYCDNGVCIKESSTKTLILDIKGSLKSSGYYGDQETPKEIGTGLLSFKTEIKNDTLRLVSKEWTYIHHSYLVEELKIQIPEKIKYEINKITAQQLAGRRIE